MLLHLAESEQAHGYHLQVHFDHVPNLVSFVLLLALIFRGLKLSFSGYPRL